MRIYATESKAFSTASLVGKAGIAPLSITVSAPQALANLRASLKGPSCWEYPVELRWLFKLEIRDAAINYEKNWYLKHSQQIIVYLVHKNWTLYKG